MPRGQRVDITGARFGQWTVVERRGRDRRGNVFWLCRCDCGTESLVLGSNLRFDRSRSCGCAGRELLRRRATTHGMCKTLEYKAWAGAKRRCEKTDDPNYFRYGARGIKMCVRWHDFAAFFADMGPRPSADHSVDRADNDRGYSCGNCADCVARGELSNCRWATAEEQARNTRRNIWIEANGETLLAVDWARRLGVSRELIRQRLNIGWDPAVAVTTPAKRSSVSIGKRAGRRGAALRRLGKATTQSILETEVILAGEFYQAGVLAALNQVDWATVRARLKSGRNLIEAVTVPVKRKPRRRKEAA